MKRKINSLLFVRMWLMLFLAFGLSSGLVAQITVDVQQKPVKEILKVIESKSNYRFFYNEGLKSLDKVVNLKVSGATIDQAMKLLLANSDISYKLESDNLVLLMAKVNDTQVMQKRIRGTVTDTNGEFIIGASVLIKGTRIGTITDVNGQFSIEVGDKSVLVVSYIGYKTKEVAVAGLNSVQVVLAEDVETLSEVVVTALGIRREEKALGYAVQAVQGDGLQTVKGVDMATSLTGKVAGLLVKNSTEFTQSPDIQIRGENPLIVIDGVPYGNMSLTDIPSDDIENISVLKGATASALYGYRGAGGAIMVTSKKGKKDKGVEISFNSGSMFAAGFLAIPELQSTFGRVVNTATNTYSTGGDGSWGIPMDGRDVKQWDPVSKSWQVMPYLPRGKDNFRNFLEPGYVLNNNLNIVQQGEYGNLRASVTWINNKGQYPNSQYNKYTYSIGGDIKLNNFLLSTGFSYNKQSSQH